jgi:hypothetical protein
MWWCDVQDECLYGMQVFSRYVTLQVGCPVLRVVQSGGAQCSLVFMKSTAALLGHYAASRKVVGSRPDEVDFFFQFT